MKYFLLSASIFLTSCSLGIPNGVTLCTGICHSQNNSEVALYGMGGCICENEEGRKMVEGYQKNINGQCNGSDEDRN